MNLHKDIKLHEQLIRATAQNMGIRVDFVEKDYWISLVLSRLAKSHYVDEAVFKGGTSLSKAFCLIDRFSEDVDIAIINNNNEKSGSKIKSILRSIEKDITADLSELSDNATSKGSKYRKSVFEYLSFDKNNGANKLIVEINSFANPFPFKKHVIKSFIYDFLKNTDNDEYISKYNLEPFELNVLDKEQTLLEKLVSLIRFSFETDPVKSISQKIRHFYDLYFLMNDPECIAFVKSEGFKTKFCEILNHDRSSFDEPVGWKDKPLEISPLITDFDKLWNQLEDKYRTELTAYAYSPIPDADNVAKGIKELITFIL